MGAGSEEGSVSELSEPAHSRRSGLTRVHSEHSEAGSLKERMQRGSARAMFDSRSLKRLSAASASYTSAGTAVNVTRTLSLDQAQWDHVLSHPSRILHGERSRRGTKLLNSNSFKSVFGLPMLDPFCKFCLIWHMLMLIMDLTYTAFCVPIGVGFDVSDTAWTWAAVCDFTAGCIFMVDMLLGFHTGYAVSYNYDKRIVMDGKQVARWYVIRGSFWVDFLSSVAWMTQLVLVILTVLGSNQERLASQIQILRILRIARLGRLFKVLFLSGAGQGLLPMLINTQKVSATAGYFLQLLYAIAVTINLLGSLWYWIADREGINNTWITEYAPFVREYGDADGVLNATTVRMYISTPRLYLTSVYWAFTTVATVGYGDITPQTALEQGVTIFAFLVGIIFFGVIIGSLTQLLQRASKDARKAQLYRDKMAYVDSWLRGRRFPVKLRKQIRDYYGQFWLRQADEADEAKLLEELPHPLRTEALWSMARESLLDAPIFASLPEPLLQLIASYIRPRTFPPGQNISMQGAPATKMWLLHFGQVMPIFNDAEGRLRDEKYMLNGVGLLQEVLPLHFQKNIRGYRTATPCGLWEWSIPMVLSACKHHVGLYEQLVHNLIREMHFHASEDVDGFPMHFVHKLEEAEKKVVERWNEEFAASSHVLSASVSFTKRQDEPMESTCFSPPRPSSDDHRASGEHQAPGRAGTPHENGEGPAPSGDVAPGEAGRIRRTSVTFMEGTKAEDEDRRRGDDMNWFQKYSAGPSGQLRIEELRHAIEDPIPSRQPSMAAPTPFAGQGQQGGHGPSETRLSLQEHPAASDSGSPNDDDAEEDGESIDPEAEELNVRDVAVSLSNIQDQLTELKMLMQRTNSLDD